MYYGVIYDFIRRSDIDLGTLLWNRWLELVNFIERLLPTSTLLSLLEDLLVTKGSQSISRHGGDVALLHEVI
jgi:hypothetical protein